MGAAASKPEPAPARSSFSNDEKLAARLTSLSLAPPSAPVSADGGLSLSNIDSWEEQAAADPKTQLARTILSHSNLQTVLTKRSAIVADPHVYNTEIAFKTGPITSQKSSGRCWLFATSNVLRYNVMEKLDLKDFQLSQSYLFFWDKLNKANYYLELSIENADLPLDDRLVYHLSGDLISDGGHGRKHPRELRHGPPSPLPESTHSSLSAPLNTLLKTKLREHALVLRALAASLRADPSIAPSSARAALRAKKEALMGEVYTVMSATLGVPPKPDAPFTWDYYDAAGKARAWTGTPREFYAAFGVLPAAPAGLLNTSSAGYSPADCFSLINDPRNAYGKLYTVDRLGNVWGGRPVLYVNTEIGDLKDAVVKMVKAGVPVFFGCDVGKFSDREMGLMNTDLFDYENAFNITLGLTKAQRLQVHESSMTHAMVISAVHLDSAGKPVRYKVENSWGEEPGQKGWFMMTDAWFDEFVYQVVAPKSLAPKHLVKIFEGKEKTVLPAWDPMGSLA